MNGDVYPRPILREIHLTDWAAFHRLLSDDEVVRFLEYGPFNERETREWLAHVIVTRYDSPRLVHHFAIDLPACGVVGWLALSTTPDLSGAWALSYALTRQYWRQGIMTRAVEKAIEFAVVELSARALWADVDTENAASAGLLTRYGFQLSPTAPPRQTLRGKEREMRRFVLELQRPTM